MLLSTDWFLKYWPRIGIAVSEPEAVFLQEGFRDIVRQIVSGAEQYWLASFSIERIRETSARIERLLECSKVREPAARRITELAASRPMSVVDDKTAWLLLSITQMLCDNSIGEGAGSLAPSAREILVKAYSACQADPEDFEEENLGSETQWDLYIRRLTPDLPTRLSDYVSTCILKQSEFETVLNLVRAAVTPDQRESILNWYRAEGSALVGEGIDLPASLLG
jgi:hypothetical protein